MLFLVIINICGRLWFNLLIMLSFCNYCVSKAVSPVCSLLHLYYHRVTSFFFFSTSKLEKSRGDGPRVGEVGATQRRGPRTTECGSCRCLGGERGEGGPPMWRMEQHPAWKLAAGDHWQRSSETLSSRGTLECSDALTFLGPY